MERMRLGIYPERFTHSHKPITLDGRYILGEQWVEEERTPGLIRTRDVHAGPWFETRTNCFCCSCGDREGSDAACRNHGYYGVRPCEKHGMPGYAWEGTEEMPESVQAERARQAARKR